jgi:hypothetical protein
MELLKYPHIDTFELITSLQKLGMTWKDLERVGFYFNERKLCTAQELEEWYQTQKVLKSHKHIIR